IFAAEPLGLIGRTAGNNVPHLVNESGVNVWTGNITNLSGGTFYGIESQAGTLVLNGSLSNAVGAGASLTLDLLGAGGGLISGGISDSVSSFLALRKSGSGTWTLSGANTFIGGIIVSNGVLQAAGPSAFPAGSTVSTTNGTLRLNGNNLLVANLSGSGGGV